MLIKTEIEAKIIERNCANGEEKIFEYEDYVDLDLEKTYSSVSLEDREGKLFVVIRYV